MPFVAANPEEEERLVWPAFQTYADGNTVNWVGSEGSERPASVTTLDADDGGGRTTSFVALAALVALVASLLSLGLVLRPRNQA